MYGPRCFSVTIRGGGTGCILTTGTRAGSSPTGSWPLVTANSSLRPAMRTDLGHLLLFEPDVPNHVENVAGHVETKIAALMAHRSQYVSTMGIGGRIRELTRRGEFRRTGSCPARFSRSDRRIRGR